MRTWLEDRGWDTTGFTINELLLIAVLITIRIVDAGLLQPWAWDLFAAANGG